MIRLGAVLALAGVAAAPASPVAELAGRYYRQFPDALVDGSRYIGENIVEIVPVAGDAAYVRVHLDYFNGHQCGIAGVARVQGNALVYREPSSPAAGQPCVLTIERSGTSLRLDDGERRSCSGYCGARGTFADVKLPWASRRPIRYLAKLKASSEYRDALAEWRTGKPAR